MNAEERAAHRRQAVTDYVSHAMRRGERSAEAFQAAEQARFFGADDKALADALAESRRATRP